jgi:hypothetical protein
MDNASDIQIELDPSKAMVILGIQIYRLDFIYLNFVSSSLDKTKNFKFKYGAFDCLRSKKHFLFQNLNLRH